LRCPPLPRSAQRLRWVAGERLVVTREFWRACQGCVPTWLADATDRVVDRPTETELKWRCRRILLRQFPPAGRLRAWWNRIRGRHQVAAGPRFGGWMFREERFGRPGPRPLAFGQRPDGGSFILFQPDDDRGHARDD
jgi:hypothetical protein